MWFNTEGTTFARPRGNNLFNVAIISLLFILSMYNTYMFEEQRFNRTAHIKSLVGQNRLITLQLITVNVKWNTERKGESILFGETSKSSVSGGLRCDLKNQPNRS